MLNGKIFVQELWVERGVGEWFSAGGNVLGSAWANFQKFTRNGTSLLVWFTNYPSSGWTRNYRLHFIELP